LRPEMQLGPALTLRLRMNEEPPLALSERQCLSSIGMQRQPPAPSPQTDASALFGQKAV
jgi:hypothetical protein